MQPSKKRVQWSTITVYEFGVGMGGSAIPKYGGPAIGLASKPQNIWSASLNEVRYVDEEACQMKERAVDGPCADADVVVRVKGDVMRPVLKKRRRVRWLKPLERVCLLTKAGLSEKRIYRMIMESSEIAMSRRLSLAV